MYKKFMITPRSYLFPTMVCQAGAVAWRAVELLRAQPGMWEAVAGCLPEAAQRSLLLGAPDLDDGDEEPPEVMKSTCFRVPPSPVHQRKYPGLFRDATIVQSFRDDFVNVSKFLCDAWM